MKKLLLTLSCVVMAVLCAFTMTACVENSLGVTAESGVRAAEAADKYDISNLANGITPAANTHYDVNKILDELPRTVEAVLTIKKDYQGRSGILIGNHRNTYGDNSFNFELQWDSSKKVHYPKLYYIDGDLSESKHDFNVQINFNFTNVALTPGTQYHLVIVHDTYHKEARCYVNGALKQTIQQAGNDADYSDYVDNAGNFLLKMDRPMRVMGDYRDNGANGCYFKGALKALSLYRDVRSDTEIYGDNIRKVYDYAYDDDLILMYDFTKPNPDYLKDLSGNGYDITYSGPDQYASVKEGRMFGVQEKYSLSRKLDATPSTYEAVIYLPKSYTGRGGVIIGNFESANSACYSMEIYSDGVLRLYFDTDQTTGVCDVRFNKVDVRTGDWVHVAVVHDKANQKASAYLDGEFVQEVSVVAPDAKFNNFNYVSTFPAMVGGDPRSGNSQYFKGLIKSVAVFSDTRTAEEIKADVKTVDTGDKNLLACYDMTSVESGEDVLDQSANGNTLVYHKSWIKPEEMEELKDYDYTFAVVGDTQWMNYCHNDKMEGIYKWIADQKSKKNVQYVFGLGDVTEKTKDWEWSTAKKAIAHIEGKIPYSMVRGNHDNCKAMYDAFNYSAYTSQFNGFYQAGCLCNSYRTMTIGKTKFLMITLDYGASDSVLSWAGNLCKQYADHKVIVTTHAYMYRDGTTLDQNDVCPPATTGGSNNGDHMWDKFVSKYENILLVMSGHDPCDDVVVRQERGVNGNMVTQMLIDAQYTDRDIGGNGMVAMLHYSEADERIQVQYYSTVRDMYFKETNQITICLDGHEFTKEVVSDEYLASPATCASKATYYKSCKCGEKGTETFTSGSILEHSYDREYASADYLASPATCNKKATYYYSCSCGKKGEETFEFGNVNPEAHVFDKKVTDDKYFKKAASCDKGTLYYYSCVCGEIGTDYFEFGEPTGNHVYDQEVVSDDYKASDATCVKKATYYKTCKCGAVGSATFSAGEFAAHVYDKKVTSTGFLVSEANCENAARYYYSCECGAKSTEKFEYGTALGHVLADDKTCHDRVCSKCNLTVSATTEHTWNDGVVTKEPTASADGEKKYTCTDCGATKTEKLDKKEGGAEDSSCATVAPAGFNGFGGGTALMLMTAFAIACILLRRKREM